MMLRTLFSALLILCSYSLHGLAQPGGCPSQRACPIISPPPFPKPLVNYPRPRPPLYPLSLDLMPRRPPNNPGPLSNRARILFITQELKRNITYDPQNYTGTWVGNNYCLFKGIFCDVVPDLNITGLASITFNSARFGGTFFNSYRFIRNLPEIAVFQANSNNFSGVIVKTLKYELDLSNIFYRYLYELDLSNNKFLGGFPSSVREKEFNAGKKK